MPSAERGGGAEKPVYLLRLEPPAGTLLVSLRPDLPCVVRLGEGESPEGEESPAAARLAGHLEGRALERVFAPAVDRTVLFEWEGGLTMRIDLLRRPVLRLMDGSSLLVVLPEGAGERGGGKTREIPGADRPDILRYDPETLPPEIGTEEEASAALRAAVRSLPGWWADEAAARAGFAGLAPRDRRSALVRAWKELAGELERSARTYLFRSRLKIHLSMISPRIAEGDPEEFADPLDAAAAWWKRREAETRREEAVREVRSAAAREKKRLRRLLEKRRGELREAEKAPLRRRQGEILSIHFRNVERGTPKVRLPDPYDGGEIEIDLDPTKSARQNIERLFRLAKKGERGAEIVRARIAETERLVASLDSLLEEVEGAKGAEEAEALRERAGPLLRAEKREASWRGKIRKPKERALPVRPREYRIAGGYTVLVGRDNKENDLLTLKIARPGDLWFHAAQAAGSHAVLLRDDPKKPVPHEALLEAAAIAAWHSKAKHASKVPVIYTEKRYVRKPKGWPPGRVTCSREKTLFVEPGVPRS
ncbi:MAG: NFACT RNA binding domain-containing protein [Candidatus Eisenbacteria bacterium]